MNNTSQSPDLKAELKSYVKPIFVEIALVMLLGAQGGGKTVIKLIVDFILFFLTFQIQREWVFRKK